MHSWAFGTKVESNLCPPYEGPPNKNERPTPKKEGPPQNAEI